MCFVDEIRKNFRQSLTDQFQIVKGAWGRHKKSTQSLVVSIIYVSILKNRITLKIIVILYFLSKSHSKFSEALINTSHLFPSPDLPIFTDWNILMPPRPRPGSLNKPGLVTSIPNLRNRTLKPDLHGGWIERIKVLNKSYRDPYTIVSPSDLQTFQRKLLLSIMKRVICNKNAKLWRFDPFFCNEWILAWSGFFSEKIRVNEMSQLI